MSFLSSPTPAVVALLTFVAFCVVFNTVVIAYNVIQHGFNFGKAGKQGPRGKSGKSVEGAPGEQGLQGVAESTLIHEHVLESSGSLSLRPNKDPVQDANFTLTVSGTTAKTVSVRVMGYMEVAPQTNVQILMTPGSEMTGSAYLYGEKFWDYYKDWETNYPNNSTISTDANGDYYWNDLTDDNGAYILAPKIDTTKSQELHYKLAENENEYQDGEYSYSQYYNKMHFDHTFFIYELPPGTYKAGVAFQNSVGTHSDTKGYTSDAKIVWGEHTTYSGNPTFKIEVRQMEPVYHMSSA